MAKRSLHVDGFGQDAMHLPHRERRELYKLIIQTLIPECFSIVSTETIVQQVSLLVINSYENEHRQNDE